MRAISSGDGVAPAHGMRSPASVPALALLAGIWIGWSLTATATLGLVGLAASLWVVSLTTLCLRSRQMFVPVTTAAFTVVGAALGAHAVAQAEQTSLSRWFHGQRSPPGPVVIWGQLQRDATPTDYGAQLLVGVERLEYRRQTVQVTGGLRVFVGGQLVAGRYHEWVAGRRVRMTVTLRAPPRYQNPGVGEQQRRLAWRGIALFGSVKSALLVEVVESGWWWQEAAASARARVRQVVHRTVGSRSTQSAGIVTAILIGDRAGLDEDTQRRLQEGGTFHVIAISGGNIAILAGLILVLLRAGGFAPPTAAALTIVSLVAYWQVVGFEASVSRATLGASLFLAARAVDHRTPALNTLAVSAICLVAANPLVLSDVGFLLTFGATLGILVGVPRVVRVVDRASWLRSRKWMRRYVVMPPVGLLAATVCAELVLLPVAASNFSRVTVAGLALNFVAIPLMTITQIAGLTAVFAYPVSVPLAELCGQVAHLATQGITSSAHLVELVPQLARRVPPPERFISVLYCAALVMFALGSSRAVRTAGGAAGALMAAVIVLGWPTTGRTGPGCPTSALRVVFLDVDQADATLLTFPSGHSMLVDAGGSIGGRSTVGERVVAPALWQAGVARLDYLVLTHGDPDHVGGAATVFRDFAPREVWEGVPVPRSAALRELQAMARNRGGVWRQTQAGDAVRIGDAEIVVQHPPPPDWERQTVRNDDSVVLEVRHQEVAFVLPGDIGSDVEAAVASRLAGAPTVVLKAPHHGSRTSSSQPLIDALRPTLAVVSAGRHNRFGHPHDEVVQRYRQAGTQVIETGRVGAVTVCSDGRRITVATERAG